MLTFFLFVNLNTCISLTSEHKKTGVTEKKFIVPFFLSHFCLSCIFFLSPIFNLFCLAFSFLLLLFLLLSLHPFLPTLSLYSCKISTLPSPHHCYILIQTTVNFSIFHPPQSSSGIYFMYDLYWGRVSHCFSCF